MGHPAKRQISGAAQEKCEEKNAAAQRQRRAAWQERTDANSYFFGGFGPALRTASGTSNFWMFFSNSSVRCAAVLS